MSALTGQSNSAHTKIRALAQRLGLQTAVDGGIKFKNGVWTPPMSYGEARRYLKVQLANRYLNRAGSVAGRRMTTCQHSDPACAACTANRERVNARNAKLRLRNPVTGVNLHASGTGGDALCGAAFNDDFAESGQTVTCDSCLQQIAHVRRSFTSSNRMRRFK